MSLQIAFRYLVDTLPRIKHVRSVRVLDEGALLVNLDQAGLLEDVVIYLLAGELSVGFIKKTLNANTQRDRYTLFVPAFDRITEDGSTAIMNDALRLLQDAYGGKLYAYRTVGSGAQVIPVSIANDLHITIGAPVNLSQLAGDYAVLNTRFIMGVRKVAGFAAREFKAETKTSKRDPLQPYFDLLGASPGDSADDIKKAYRRKARQHHPDANPSPDATLLMQRINEAYERIMDRLTRRG